MCAIFGLGFQNHNRVTDKGMISHIVKRLFINSVTRGRDASGIAFCSSNNINVFKKNIPSTKLIDRPEYKKAMQNFLSLIGKKGDEKPISIIGHTRAKTKGSELNNINNHPIVRQEVVGVHNGMISNDDQVFKQYADVMNRNGQVDSEIIFALIEAYSKGQVCKPVSEAIYKMSTELNGSMACSLLHRRHPYAVWIFRNHNPCSIIHFKEIGLIIWSTSENFIDDATEGLLLGKASPIELEQDKCVELDLHRNRIYRFDLGGNKNSWRLYGRHY